MDILEKRSEILEAVWLWILLNRNISTKAVEKWWPVHGGVPYNDESLSAALDVRTETARKWRLRLERAGFVRSFLTSPRKRRLEVRNLAWKEEPGPSAELPDEISPREAAQVVQ